MRILITEDDITSRELLSSLITKHGYEVIAVKDAYETIEKLDCENPPDLMLLDVLMPGMDGLALCQKIRKDYNLICPYIIMLTVKGSKSDIISGFDAGADDYITKPFNSGELFARINVGAKMIQLQRDLHSKVKEQEIILAEVHHRMKNNMATIGSILDLQAATLDNPVALAALHDAKNRLSSMSILYDKLYRSKNIKRMAVTEYIPVLVEQIVSQFPNAHNVQVNFELDNFFMGAKRLTNLGIVINELCTNAMKHAFGQNEGTITIRGKKTDKLAFFEVEDDGIANKTIDDNCSGFGLKLIAMLIEQLNGSLNHRIGSQGHGLCFLFTLEDDMA